MSKPRKKKRPPKRVLALPDLEQSKAAVLNSLPQRAVSAATIARSPILSIGTLFRTASRIQPHRRSAIQDLSRTEAVRSHNHQSALGCRSTSGV
jgi:hypothetical protein